MKLNISVKNKKEIERFILIMNIGMMVGMKDGSIGMREAHDYIYSPYSVEKLENLEIDEDVLLLVKLGCELEDVASLIPESLEASMDDILNNARRLLKLSSQPYEIPLKKWIV